jgi:hypothetical protein
MFKAILVGMLAVGILVLGASRVTAQQVAISTPFNRVNESFFERIGIGFGFDINGGRNVVGLNPLGNPTANGRIPFRQNSVGAVAPAFGGFDANAAARTGFRIQGSGFSADLLGVFAQGSSRSIISDTPKIVIPNGGTGTISDTSQRPFVTGVIPIVGSNGGIIYNVPRPYWPTGPAVSYTYPLHDTIRRYYANQEQLQKEGEAEYARDFALKRDAARKAAESSADVSSAAQGDLSVAEIRRQKTARDAAEAEKKNQELAILIERGRGAEEAGKIGVAKIYYRQAAAAATGDLKRQLIEKLRSLNAE